MGGIQRMLVEWTVEWLEEKGVGFSCYFSPSQCRGLNTEITGGKSMTCNKWFLLWALACGTQQLRVATGVNYTPVQHLRFSHWGFCFLPHWNLAPGSCVSKSHISSRRAYNIDKMPRSWSAICLSSFSPSSDSSGLLNKYLWDEQIKEKTIFLLTSISYSLLPLICCIKLWVLFFWKSQHVSLSSDQTTLKQSVLWLQI